MNVEPAGAPLDRPYRGDASGLPRGVPLPPQRLPLLRGGQLRKRWRYLSLWGPEISLCAARVEVGLLPREYCAICDHRRGRLSKRTHFFANRVDLSADRLRVDDGNVSIDVVLEPTDAFDVYRPEKRAYIWSHKELYQRVRGSVRVDGAEHDLRGVGFVDVSAGYHARRTSWRWSAGAGVDVEGRGVAWSAIVGLFDTPESSERTLWIEGVGHEIGPVSFSDDLTTVAFADGAELHFREEAALRMHDNLLVIRADYEHAFGSYSGALPGGIEIREAHGVRERQDAVW